MCAAATTNSVHTSLAAALKPVSNSLWHSSKLCVTGATDTVAHDECNRLLNDDIMMRQNVAGKIISMKLSIKLIDSGVLSISMWKLWSNLGSLVLTKKKMIASFSVVAAANHIYRTYDRSITPTKNIGLPDSMLSRFDLLFIVLDQMDPVIDREISDHVLRMHRFRSAADGAEDSVSMYGREDETDADSSVFVEFNRMLHGQIKGRRVHVEALKIKFLKKYIHYAKHMFQPDLTDEAFEYIATAYTELRNTGGSTRTGGTLPITARTLDTIIRFSTAHAKLKLSKQDILMRKISQGVIWFLWPLDQTLLMLSPTLSRALTDIFRHLLIAKEITFETGVMVYDVQVTTQMQ